VSETVAFVALQTPVRVVSNDPAVAARLRVCYGTFAGQPAHGAPIEASVERRGDSFAVRVAGRDDATAPDLIGAVSALNHELLHAVMLRNLHLFYVHAGVVAFGARAIVLPGLSRAGKSTIVLALLQEGARLLSDELAVYDPATGALLPFPRAVKVRDECVAYFPALAHAFVGSGEGRFLRPDALGTERAAPHARARLIAAPQWRENGATVLEPLSQGQGLLHLVSAALNFGSQRERSIDHLAALASDTECVALPWRCPHTAAKLLRARLEATAPCVNPVS
jgi:hypothetical protein